MSNCLLLIDIQNDYFENGNMELKGINEAASNAQLLLKYFRKANFPIIHIQHFSVRPEATFFLPNTVGVEINKMVYPLEDEIVIKKNFPNSFRDTDLLKTLNEMGVKTLTVCGAMSHMCIDATTRAAFDYQFECIVAEDACATKSLTFQDTVIRASEVHASFMAALSVPYAEVISTKEIIKKLA